MKLTFELYMSSAGSGWAHIVMNSHALNKWCFTDYKASVTQMTAQHTKPH